MRRAVGGRQVVRGALRYFWVCVIRHDLLCLFVVLSDFILFFRLTAISIETYHSHMDKATPGENIGFSVRCKKDEKHVLQVGLSLFLLHIKQHIEDMIIIFSENGAGYGCLSYGSACHVCHGNF